MLLNIVKQALERLKTKKMTNPKRVVTKLHLFIYDTRGKKLIHFEKTIFFRILTNFHWFQTLLKRAHFGGSASDDVLQTPQKIWKYHSIISKLSDLVEEHLSYLWIYFGRLGDVWDFRNWIFQKKSSKKGSLQKYPPPAESMPCYSESVYSDKYSKSFG